MTRKEAIKLCSELVTQHPELTGFVHRRNQFKAASDVYNFRFVAPMETVDLSYVTTDVIMALGAVGPVRVFALVSPNP